MATDSDFSRLDAARHKDVIEALHGDIAEMKGALRELTAAITKLALIEQQMSYSARAQERAFTALEKLETRVSDIERQLPLIARTNVWVERVVIAAAAASLMFVAKASGLIGG